MTKSILYLFSVILPASVPQRNRDHELSPYATLLFYSADIQLFWSLSYFGIS